MTANSIKKIANPIQPSRTILASGVLSHTDIRLNGHNYREWEFSVFMLLQLVSLASHLINDPFDKIRLLQQLSRLGGLLMIVSWASCA